MDVLLSVFEVGLGVLVGVPGHGVAVEVFAEAVGGQVNVFHVLGPLVVLDEDAVFGAVASGGLGHEGVGAHAAACAVDAGPDGAHHRGGVEKPV